MRELFNVTTSSTEETEACGARLAKAIMTDESLPRFVAFRGDLGVGKTAFTRGFASVIAPSSTVRSPTFALVNEYKTGSRSMRLFHFDMYRITDDDDLYSTGFYDYLDLCERGRAICIVEWSENIPMAIPQSFVEVTISKIDGKECSRLIRCTVGG